MRKGGCLPLARLVRQRIQSLLLAASSQMRRSNLPSRMATIAMLLQSRQSAGSSRESYVEPFYSFALCLLGFGYLAVNRGSTYATFLQTWALLQLFGMVVNMSRQRCFYKWWYQSQMVESGRRGFSTYGYPLFGILPMPTLSPRTLNICLALYPVSLAAVAVRPAFPTVGSAFVLALLVFSSLWAERSLSYHRTVSTLFVFVFSLIWSLSNPVYEDSLVTMLKIYIASIYSISVVQKLATSVLAGKFWPKWSPHGFLWKSIWAKPYHARLQKFLFLNPRLCYAGGLFSMLVELSPLLQFVVPGFCSHLIYLLLFQFHLFVFMGQGIDYMTFWMPALLIGAIHPSQFTLSWNPVGAVILLSMQLVYALFTMENWNINMPPLMSCPMFVTLSQVNDKTPSHYILTDEARSPIKYERLEWMYPYMTLDSSLGFSETDISKIPFKFVACGYYVKPQNFPKMVHRYFITTDESGEEREEGPYVMTNLDTIDDVLVSRLKLLMTKLHAPSSTFDPYQHLEHVYNDFQECRNIFLGHTSNTM